MTRGLKSKLDVVRAHVAALTPRERQVFDLIIRGDTNKHVARALGCTERTIKAHRHRVMEKMKVRSLPELVSLAERFGIASAAGPRQFRVKRFRKVLHEACVPALEPQGIDLRQS